MLQVQRLTSVGAFLANEQGDEVLLPNKYIPEGLEEDDFIDVFVYYDSKGRIISTTLEPKIELHQFAWLQVKQISQYGAFVDIGLEKDQLIPFREQKKALEAGEWTVVYMYLDPLTGRLLGSTSIHKFLQKGEPQLNIGQEVQILVYEKTDLGWQVVIENLYKGMIYDNEIFEKIKIGDRKKAWVKKIREDYKIDLQLKPIGYTHVEADAAKILQILNKNGGFLNLSDKSNPEEIYQLLHMSKKTFKKAIGALYKDRLVELDENGIYLMPAED